jgi:hypothetical protein
MTSLSQSPITDNMLEGVPVAPRTTGGLQLGKRISLIAKWIASYIETMADYYAAATMYEQLSRLSDAELQRRGLSRTNLARDVLVAHDRTGLD